MIFQALSWAWFNLILEMTMRLWYTQTCFKVRLRGSHLPSPSHDNGLSSHSCHPSTGYMTPPERTLRGRKKDIEATDSLPRISFSKLSKPSRITQPRPFPSRDLPGSEIGFYTKYKSVYPSALHVRIGKHNPLLFSLLWVTSYLWIIAFTKATWCQLKVIFVSCLCLWWQTWFMFIIEDL